jgi:predicted nicotinamide N-methyase
MATEQPSHRDEIEIPEEVAAVYGRLRSRFRLEWEEVGIGGRRFRFLTVSDLEPLLNGKDPFANTLDFPFWVKVWEAAVVLGFYLSRQPRGSLGRCLELGAGLGVAGIVAAGFGHEVVVTDYKEEILDFPRVSAAVNGVAERVDVERLDWTAPADLGQFDTIIGSEILFHERFFTPLLRVFQQYLKPNGQIILAHDVRRKSLRPFLERCGDEYEIGVQKQRISAGDEGYEILLNRLRPRLQ